MHASSFVQVVRDLPVIHGLVHTNVKSLLPRFWMIECEDHALDQVVDVNKVAFHRQAIGIEHYRNGVLLDEFVRALRPNEIAPAQTPENIFSERECVLEL